MRNFSVTYLNSTTVNVQWVPNGATYYRVFYYASNCQGMFATYPGNIREAAIGGLCSCLENVFSISATFEISGKIFEGEKSPPVLPGNDDILIALYKRLIITIDSKTHQQ